MQRGRERSRERGREVEREVGRERVCVRIKGNGEMNSYAAWGVERRAPGPNLQTLAVLR